MSSSLKVKVGQGNFALNQGNHPTLTLTLVLEAFRQVNLYQPRIGCRHIMEAQAIWLGKMAVLPLKCFFFIYYPAVCLDTL